MEVENCFGKVRHFTERRGKLRLGAVWRGPAWHGEVI